MIFGDGNQASMHIGLKPQTEDASSASVPRRLRLRFMALLAERYTIANPITATGNDAVNFQRATIATVMLLGGHSAFAASITVAEADKCFNFSHRQTMGFRAWPARKKSKFLLHDSVARLSVPSVLPAMILRHAMSRNLQNLIESQCGLVVLGNSPHDLFAHSGNRRAEQGIQEGRQLERSVVRPLGVSAYDMSRLDQFGCDPCGDGRRLTFGHDKMFHQKRGRHLETPPSS